jgi:hypothetical protein
VPRDDGHPQRIFRCQRCQVAVFSQYGRAELLYVRSGTLDDSTTITPDVHIYTRSKVEWVTLPQGTPAFEEYCVTDKLWPAGSYPASKPLFPGHGNPRATPTRVAD